MAGARPKSSQKTVKLTEAEDSAQKQHLDSHESPSPARKPEPSLEKKYKLEERRMNFLNRESNKVAFAIREREAKLKELRKTERALDLNLKDKAEEEYQQRKRQLENSIQKMEMKTAAAEQINKAYREIYEHLKQEVHGSFKQLEGKQRAVAVGQAKVDKLTKPVHSAAANAGSAKKFKKKCAKAMRGEKEKKKQMDSELFALAAQLVELKMEMGKQEGCLSLPGPNLRAQEKKEEEEEGETQAVSDEENQPLGIPGASQSDMKLMEDMMALGITDLQGLLDKVVSQRATEEQLLSEITQKKEILAQMTQTQADLELKYMELKFKKPAASRIDNQVKDAQMRLDVEKSRVRQKQAALKKMQDQLETVEQEVDNLYFRMSTVPVEGLESGPISTSLDKLRDVHARLPILKQRALEQRAKHNILDKDEVYVLLEKQNTLNPRNNRRPLTPTDSDDDDDDDEQEEEGGLSREDIKRRSNRMLLEKTKR